MDTILAEVEHPPYIFADILTVLEVTVRNRLAELLLVAAAIRSVAPGTIERRKR